MIFFTLIELSQLFFLFIFATLFLKNKYQYIDKFKITGTKKIYSDTNNPSNIKIIVNTDV